MRYAVIVAVLIVSLPAAGFAQHGATALSQPGMQAGEGAGAHGHATPYAGQHNRAIKSLSQGDIETLRRGGGWGLAKAAELNGMPGPLHLLEFKHQIDLEPDQVAAIEALYERMRAAAVAEGARLIELEAALDREFRDATITRESLGELLAGVERSRATLRFIHLSAHLETPALLSAAQVARYNRLRGYERNDINNPCASVPQGHDAAMWRSHNGCR